MSMTNSQAAELVALLHGAFPGSYFDGAVAEVFTNSLLTCDYERALEAVSTWCRTQTTWPTIVELNALMRRQSERAAEESNVRQLRPRDEMPPKQIAAEAFARGYRKARREAGEDADETERKLPLILRSWNLPPTTEPEHPEREGSGHPLDAP